MKNKKKLINKILNKNKNKNKKKVWKRIKRKKFFILGIFIRNREAIFKEIWYRSTDDSVKRTSSKKISITRKWRKWQSW